MPDGLTAWIRKVYTDPEQIRMGHAQRAEDLNLGLGWIYYGLARVARPARVVVIGSYRGFAPLIFARALADNAGAGEDEPGRVAFIDPSLVDDFWRDPARVQAHFAEHGLDNIDHHCMTTQDFVKSAAYQELGDIGILLVDGYHSESQARFDHEAFIGHLGADGYALFHDSVREFVSPIYGPGKHYVHDVYRYLNTLRRDPTYEVLTLPFDQGLCMVRSIGETEPSSD